MADQSQRLRLRHPAFPGLCAVWFVAIVFAACGQGASENPSATTETTHLATVSASTASPEVTMTSIAAIAQVPVPGLYLVNADGAGLRRVLTEEPILPEWSPDGTRLATIARQVTVVDVASGAVQQFGPDRSATMHWSSDGHRLLITTPRSTPTETDVAIVDTIDGSRTVVGQALSAQWLPDGRILLGGMTCDEFDEVRIADASGGGSRPLLAAYPHAGAYVSPDGKAVAYFEHGTWWSQKDTADTVLHVARIDGSDARSLPTSDLARGKPLWSPNGNYIAYTPRPSEGSTSVWLLDADGVQPRIEITDAGEALEWAPNSSQLAVRTGDGISVFDTRNGSLRRLISSRAYLARWSPDGTRIAFVGTAAGGATASLFRYDLGSGETTRLTDDTIYASMFTWSPDGRQIAVVGISGGKDYGPCL